MWLGPFEVKKVSLYRVSKVRTEAKGTFTVDGLQLKHYIAGEPINGKFSHYLSSTASS